jgi:hypothetical protein
MHLIHSDVPGPLRGFGPSGQCYWINSLEEFTKTLVAYAIIHKSGAFECFCQLKNQYKRGVFRITRFRTDGGECT